MQDLSADAYQPMRRRELDVVPVEDAVSDKRLNFAALGFHRVRAIATHDPDRRALVAKHCEIADGEQPVIGITTPLGMELVTRGDGASMGRVSASLSVGGIEPALVFFVADADGEPVPVTADASDFDHACASPHVALVTALAHWRSGRVESCLRSAAAGVAGKLTVAREASVDQVVLRADEYIGVGVLPRNEIRSCDDRGSH